MSYNISYTKYVQGQLTINVGDARRLYKMLIKAGELAEGNFLDSIFDEDLNNDEEVVITHPWWYGERSGRTYESFLEALSFTKRKAHILVVWNDGDRMIILDVNEGGVVERVCNFVAGEEITE